MQFTKKTSSSKNILAIVIKLGFIIFLLVGATFLLNKIDFPTPKKEIEFPGLKEGDRWCLCAGRWFQAYEDGYAPKIILSSTSIEVVKYIDKEILKKFALDLN